MSSSAHDSLNYSSVLDFLNQIEKEFPVTEWKLLGFHIWPIIRISLGLKLSLKSYIKEKNQLTSSQSSLISDSLKSIYSSLYNSVKDSSNNQSLNKNYDVIFLNVSSTRYYKLGEKWFNPFSDSFINYLEKDNLNSLVLEYTDTTEPKTPRYRPSKYIGTGINMMNLNVLFEKRFDKINFSHLQDFDKFLLLVNLPSDFFLKKILRVSNYSIYFEKILKKSNPSLVMVEGFYSYIAMGLLLAASRQKIKCIDVQHGVQSENDFLFSNWTNIPSNGYELLPESFWCWTGNEKENIDAWAKNANGNYSSFIGGNPVLELNENDAFINSYRSEIEKMKNSSINSVNVLYTHQAAFEISELLFNVIKDSPDNWNWFMRFHPQYSQAEGEVLAKLAKYNFKNVITGNVTEYPLSLLLQNMNLHVTEFSSSVLEAEMLGIPSILLSRAGADLFCNQIISGIAKFTVSKEDFFYDAQTLLGSENKTSVNSNKNNFESGIEMIKKLVKEKKNI